MYTNPQAVSKTNNLTFAELNTYGFAAKENFCPVLLSELPQIAREYFICFPNDKSDLPQVLLGFENGVNKYVTGSGTWQADYIPAYIRRYPFILAKIQGHTQKAGEFTLAAELDAPHFQQATGEPLFKENGKASEALDKRLTLLQSIERQTAVTRKLVREIDKLGLFKVEQMSVTKEGQKVAAISGIRMIDVDKLSKLSLKPGPMLEVIYAHLFSKANLRYGLIAEKSHKTTQQYWPLQASIEFDDDMIKFS